MTKKDIDKFTHKTIKPVKKSTKTIINIITVILAIIIVLACNVGYYDYIEEPIKPDWLAKLLNRYDKNDSKDTLKYSTEALYSLLTYPNVDGSTATIPLAKAFKANFTECNPSSIEIVHSKTHQAYEKLVNQEVDLILVNEPSAEELQLAKNKKVEYDITKVVNEGFVFFVNKLNPIDSLTVEQIQDIYSGKITNWNQVGGNDEPIIPYQRPQNSVSQTGMENIVMFGKELMQAPEINLTSETTDVMDVISDYENGRGSIGYSYYYYVKTLYSLEDVKMVKVNGVEPNNDSIKSGEYPFVTAYYAVTLKGINEKADKLKENMLSSRGQHVVEQAGYIPVK